MNGKNEGIGGLCVGVRFCLTSSENNLKVTKNKQKLIKPSPVYSEMSASS